MGQLVCWNCGGSLPDDPREPITRHHSCQTCFADLHTCTMCLHYDPGRPAQCDHDRAEPVVEKKVSNFCDFFAQRHDAYDMGEGSVREAAKSRLDGLFDGDATNAPDSDSDEARAAHLEDPFADPLSDRKEDTLLSSDDAASRFNDLFKN